MNSRSHNAPGKERKGTKIVAIFNQWSHMATILITSFECEWVLVKPIEMKDYAFAGVSKNTGVTGM